MKTSKIADLNIKDRFFNFALPGLSGLILLVPGRAVYLPKPHYANRLFTSKDYQHFFCPSMTQMSTQNSTEHTSSIEQLQSQI